MFSTSSADAEIGKNGDYLIPQVCLYEYACIDSYRSSTEWDEPFFQTVKNKCKILLRREAKSPSQHEAPALIILRDLLRVVGKAEHQKFSPALKIAFFACALFSTPALTWLESYELDDWSLESTTSHKSDESAAELATPATPAFAGPTPAEVIDLLAKQRTKLAEVDGEIKTIEHDLKTRETEDQDLDKKLRQSPEMVDLESRQKKVLEQQQLIFLLPESQRRHAVAGETQSMHARLVVLREQKAILEAKMKTSGPSGYANAARLPAAKTPTAAALAGKR
jgi:hypothetical protein